MATGEPKWFTALTVSGSGVNFDAAAASVMPTEFTTITCAPADPWAAFAPAPVSDVQTCALAWLKGGDWSAVGPLLDALEEQRRYEDAREIRLCVAGRAMSAVSGGYGGVSNWHEVAMRCLWFDLFDLHGTLSHIAAKSKGPR